MPFSGGAIQAAILPGSTTRCISDELNARSLALGSHDVMFASYSACEMGRPDKSVGTPAQFPIVRRKRVLGSMKRNAWPDASISLFQRPRPRMQSSAYELR